MKPTTPTQNAPRDLGLMERGERMQIIGRRQERERKRERDGQSFLDAERELEPEHLEYLAERGISEFEAMNRNMVSITPGEALPSTFPRALRENHEGGILMPRYDHEGNLRFRFWNAAARPGFDGDPVLRHSGEPYGKFVADVGEGLPSSYPFMSEEALEKIHEVDNVLLIEGEAAYYLFDSLGLDDWVVLGLAGCYNWKSEGEVADWVPDLLAGKTRVVVGLDGDITTKRMVWCAGRDLNQTLIDFGVEKVSFLNPPYTPEMRAAGDGPGDFVAKAGEEKMACLSELLENSAPFATVAGSRIPKGDRSNVKRTAEGDSLTLASMSDLAPIVDEANAKIRKPSVEIDGQVFEGKKIAEFAARVVAVHRTWDDLKGMDDEPDISRDIEVTLPNGHVQVVRDVPDDHMEQPRKFLNRVRRGDRVIFNQSLQARGEISLAIRNHRASETIDTIRLKRTGWFKHPDTGLNGFVTPNGMITATGMDRNTQSRLDNLGYQRLFDLPDPSEASLEEKVAAVNAINESFTCFHNPTAWATILGHIFNSVIGVNPYGAVVVVGKPGSGKTHVIQSAMSLFGPGIGYKRGLLGVSLRNSTKTIHMTVGEGLHHATTVLEDVRQLANIREQEEQAKAVDTAIGRAYEGSSAARARFAPDGKGGFKAMEADQANPFFFITAERMADLLAITSTEQRLFRLEFENERDSYVKGGALKMEGLTQHFPLFMAMSLQAVAKWQDEMDEHWAENDLPYEGCPTTFAANILDRAAGKVLDGITLNGNADDRAMTVLHGVVAGLFAFEDTAGYVVTNLLETDADTVRANIDNGNIESFIWDSVQPDDLVKRMQTHLDELEMREEHGDEAAAMANSIASLVSRGKIGSYVQGKNGNPYADDRLPLGIYHGTVTDPASGVEVAVVKVDAECVGELLRIPARQVRKAMMSVAVKPKGHNPFRVALQGRELDGRPMYVRVECIPVDEWKRLTGGEGDSDE